MQHRASEVMRNYFIDTLARTYVYVSAVASCEVGDREEHGDYDIIEESQEAQIAPPLPGPRKVCFVCMNIHASVVLYLTVTNSLFLNGELPKLQQCKKLIFEVKAMV